MQSEEDMLSYISECVNLKQVETLLSFNMCRPHLSKILSSIEKLLVMMSRWYNGSVT